MEGKPIITHHGDQNLFRSLLQGIGRGMPRESVEWRRSYGRAPRNVYIEATYMPFAPENLPKETSNRLVGQPYLHTYWTDCDVDTYKQTVKDDINKWMGTLKAQNIADWLIVVIVNDESKMKSKLLRTSTLDKVKSDFCSKQAERCVVLTEPFKNEAKSAESWALLLARMRQLMLQAYNNCLNRFEDNMRAQREKRNETGWDFCQFLLLQEELAFMFEMLGLFEDSLVQYDELDALFTQFVLNHAAGDTAEWLNSLCRPCTRWDGLCLERNANDEKRSLIQKGEVSLLDLRNYLFSRQCALLLLLNRPWEVAHRSIPFMHNCVKELDFLEINMSPGCIACWVFLSCLEVLNTCERFSDSSHVTSYTLYTASLWEYARKKLHELGLLCGLMPDVQPSSSQLNMVVDLISGIGESEDTRKTGPREKLREALSSKEHFQKHYLELSELAMGTFKHIGRIRSARLIGKDLATFYMKLGEANKAETFLADALKTYQREQWGHLADNTRMEIARCQKSLGNNNKYVRSCVEITCSQVLDEEVKATYLQEMLAIAKEQTDEPIQLRCRPAFTITEVAAKLKSVILGEKVEVEVSIINHLLESIETDAISISLIHQAHEAGVSSPEDERKSGHSRQSSLSSLNSISSPDALNTSHDSTGPNPATVDVQEHFEMRGERVIISSSLVCKSFLKRVDSGPSYFREKEVIKEDFSLCVRADCVTLQPGINTLLLTGTGEEKGTCILNQACIQVGGLEFLKSLATLSTGYEVVCDDPTVVLVPEHGTLMAGMIQEMILTVTSGSHSFVDPASLKLVPADSSLHLEIENAEDGVAVLPPAQANESGQMRVTAIADLGSKADKFIEHQVSVECGWLPALKTLNLSFQHPLTVSYKLHTAGKKKFLQVVILSSSQIEFSLKEPNLTTANPDVQFLSLNKPSQSLIVNAELSASYMWQLQLNTAEAPSLDCHFTVTYHQTDAADRQPRKCHHSFTIENYQTQYVLKLQVLPLELDKTHRAGCLSSLRLQVKPVKDANLPSGQQQLFYQLNPGNAYWQIVGKTSGIFDVGAGDFEKDMKVIPLIGGYLPVPSVTLMHYQSTQTPTSNGEDQKSEEKKESSEEEHDNVDMSNTAPFEVGQVYNSSISLQIQVQPANIATTTDIKLTV